MIYNISLDAYAPVISDQARAKEILKTLQDYNPKENQIIMDFSKIVSMTTTSAKLIFGAFYNELGPDVFRDHIVLKDITDDVFYIIKTGIKHYMLSLN